MRKDSATARRLLGEHIRVSKQARLLEYDEWERETGIIHDFPGVLP